MKSKEIKNAFRVIAVFFIFLWCGLAYTIYLAVRNHESPLIAHQGQAKRAELRFDAGARLSLLGPQKVQTGKNTMDFELKASKPIQQASAIIKLERRASARNAQEIKQQIQPDQIQNQMLRTKTELNFASPGEYELSLRLIYNQNQEAYKSWILVAQ
jgi:hypothetical protein